MIKLKKKNCDQTKKKLQNKTKKNLTKLKKYL